MKKLLIVLFALLLLLPANVYAADTKVSALSDIVSPVVGDDMYVVEDPDGTPASTKISIGALFGVATDLDANGVISANAVGLTTDTTGNYVTSITNGTGITGGDGGSEGAALTLAASLGTAIDTSEITDSTILEADLNVSNAPTDNYVLSYNLASSNFTWVPDAGGAETNSLEATITGILNTEILIGTGTDTAIYSSLSGDVAMDNAGVVTVQADVVDDTHIDWGTGANQVSAVDVPIADSGAIITATEAEGALQENRTAIDLNTTHSSSDGTDHTGVLLTDGSRALAGSWSLGSQTLTNLVFDANGTGNSLSNVDAADISSWTSAELATILSDETGTNTAVFSDDATLTRPVLVDIVDPSSKVSTVAAAGATETLDYTVAQVFDITLDQACTLTFSNPPASGSEGSFVLYLRQEASGGGNAVTWPASVDWASATAPTLTTGVNDLSILVFSTLDGGTTWHGMLGSGDSS